MMRHLLVCVASGLASISAVAQADVTVSTYVFPTSGMVGSGTDAFDVSQGTVVTGTSGYNDVSRPENALGGTSATSESQALVFADGTQQLQTLSFKTAAPVLISGYNLYLGEDPASNGSIRGFDTVNVFGSLDGVGYTSLGGVDLTNPYQSGYGSTTILVTSTFASAAYQYFRFEGTPYDQGSFSESFSGGRIFELDAISGTPSTPTMPVAAAPEPASWVLMLAGAGMIGAGLRFRRRRTTLRYA